MRELPCSRSSDALYQGTTLVGPFSPNKDEGLSLEVTECASFLAVAALMLCIRARF
jgi:hypothetical protein